MRTGARLLRASLLAATVGAALLPGSALAVDGDLDTLFDGDGKLVTDLGTYALGQDVVVQPDGKIVVVGESNGDVFAARYTPNGTLDTTFSSDAPAGIFNAPDLGGDAGEIANKVSLQADGSLVLAGKAKDSATAPFDDIVLIRLDDDGVLDAGFDGQPGTGDGENGAITVNLGPGATAEDATGVAVVGGQIVIGGTYDVDGSGAAFSDLFVARFSASTGVLDTGFNTPNGFRTLSLSSDFDFAGDMEVLPSGRIVLAGGANGATQLAFAGFTSTGALDTAFSPGAPAGYATFLAPGAIGTATGFGAIERQSDGKLVFAGGQTGSGAPFDGDIALVRTDQDGGFDTSFGGDGFVTAEVNAVDGYEGLTDVEQQPDGQLMVTGAHQEGVGSTDFFVGRFDVADGDLDTTFSPGAPAGFTTTDLSGFDQPLGLDLNANTGKAYVVGNNQVSLEIAAYRFGIPDAPFVNSISPANTADTLTPKIQGDAAGATEVWIFTNDTCTGAPAAQGTPAAYEDAGIEVTVLPGTQTPFWAQAINGAISSDCSTVHGPGPGANQVYSVIPIPPVLASTNPPSGSNNNSPLVIGTGRSDSNTVQIYTAAGCPGMSQVGTGILADFEGAGIQVSVPDNSTTTFYAQATGTYGFSACSPTGLSYAEVTPPASPVEAGPTGQRAAALKKCAKIKSKAKKKKCKKKARKLPV